MQHQGHAPHGAAQGCRPKVQDPRVHDPQGRSARCGAGTGLPDCAERNPPFVDRGRTGWRVGQPRGFHSRHVYRYLFIDLQVNPGGVFIPTDLYGLADLNTFAIGLLSSMVITLVADKAIK